MKHEIMYQPSYAMAKLILEKDESVRAESGAMVSMSANMEVNTGLQAGGVWGALKRSVLGGESFFVNTFTAKDGAGEINLAPVLTGDIYIRKLTGTAMMVQSGAYLAGSTTLEVDTKWGGAKTFFSGKGLFMLRISGNGDLLISSYGAIHELELAKDEKYVIDTGHVVAFEEGVGYVVRKVGSWKTTIFSGEGLVVELTGPGKVWLQTRSFSSFMNYLIPKLPKSGS